MELRSFGGASRYPFNSRFPEIYDVYGAKSGLVRGAKFVRKEEINLSDGARCYFIYSADEVRFLRDGIVLGTSEEESNGTR